MAQFNNAEADWRVTLDGEDLTDKISPRLISLTLDEKLSESSDQLNITIHDHDGLMEIPTSGQIINVEMGWKRGSDVTIGLVDKGSFKVDEAEYSGAPDIITIKARSANLDSEYRTRRNKAWQDSTIGDIIGEVASDNDLTPLVHDSLANIVIPILDQASKSDMTLVRDLGRRYDAVATVKNQSLIFAPIDSDTTASGQEIPSLLFTRRAGNRFTYRRTERGTNFKGAEAKWRDQKSAKRVTETAGESPYKMLKRIYGNQEDAKAAAQAEWQRIQRSGAEFDYDLALGEAAIYPGQKAKLSGWKSEVDNHDWRIVECRHSIGANGFTTSIKLELAG